MTLGPTSDVVVYFSDALGALGPQWDTNVILMPILTFLSRVKSQR